MVILGNYTVDNYLVGSSGPFNITLTNVTATGTVDLATNDEGKLYANGSTIDMTYKDIAVSASIIRFFTPTFR